MPVLRYEDGRVVCRPEHDSEQSISIEFHNVERTIRVSQGLDLA